MKNFLGLFITALLFLGFIELSQTKNLKLASKDFQNEFLQNFTQIMQTETEDSFADFLMLIFKTAYKYGEKYEDDWRLALASNDIQLKISFIKQYLEMEDFKNINRDNMYALNNIVFLEKFKNNLQQMQEQHFKEKQYLRFYYLCQHLKVKQLPDKSNERNFVFNLNPFTKLRNYALKGISISSVNITSFGRYIYEDVNKIAADIIDDTLLHIMKLLKEILKDNSPTHKEIINKILLHIDNVYNIKDFYLKHKKLYDYLENNLHFNFEQLTISNNQQPEFLEILNQLKNKGLDLEEEFLFNNLEFIDYIFDIWRKHCPQGDLQGFDDYSRPLKQVQDSYDNFKEDSSNSLKYSEYLNAVKLLHQQTKRDNEDTFHIYEILLKTSQNLNNKSLTIITTKCLKIKNNMNKH